MSLIVVILLLFKSIYAEENTEPRKRKKKGEIYSAPFRSRTLDTLPLSHYVIDTYNSEKPCKYTYRKCDKGIAQIQS